jgi:hypothetical protein
MSLTKLSLAGNNLNYSRDGKQLTFFTVYLITEFQTSLFDSSCFLACSGRRPLLKTSARFSMCESDSFMKRVWFLGLKLKQLRLNKGYDGFLKLPDAFWYLKIYLFFRMRTSIDKCHNVELVFVQAFPASCWSVLLFENFSTTWALFQLVRWISKFYSNFKVNLLIQRRDLFVRHQQGANQC